MSKRIYSFIFVLILSFLVCTNNIDAKKISEANLGDYIKMTPTSTSYNPLSSVTGCMNDTNCTQNTINPSELNLWRIIRKNDDGTVDVVSEYVSSTKVYFYGKTGYMNIVGTLNTIAAQYTNTKYVQSTRHMGYNNQIETCISLDSCLNDRRYTTDTGLVENAIGTLIGKNLSGKETEYLLASRFVGTVASQTLYCQLLISTTGKVSSGGNLWSVKENGEGYSGSYGYAIRPILTLKADIDLPISSSKEDSSAVVYDFDNPIYPEPEKPSESNIAKKVSELKIGDYIKVSPKKSSYTIPKTLTGCESDQTINPSELNLWRVIRKNDDGTVDVVSEYVSSKSVCLGGTKGYMNIVGALNTIAAQYTNEKYVQSTRHMGYSNQIEICKTLSKKECPADNGFEIDTNLVKVATGSLVGKKLDGAKMEYWLSSRYISTSSDGIVSYLGRYITTSGAVEFNKYFYTLDYENYFNNAVRPILTLKADIDLPTPNDNGNDSILIYDLDSLDGEPETSTEDDNDNQGYDNVKDEQNNGKDELTDKESLKNEIENPDTGGFLVCALLLAFVILAVVISNIAKTRKIFKI